MSLVTKLSLCLLTFSAAAFAQFPLSVGVKAGVPLTDAFSSNTPVDTVTKTFSDSKNYIVGPTVELKLPFHLSVEADALYRPLAGTVQAADGSQRSTNYTTWEFPILAKYHLSFPVVSPYIEAGPSFRTRSENIGNLSSNGFTVGAGTDIRALFLRISPEFRYTRWGSDSTSANNAVLFSSKPDQVEFLVGFSF